jgi:hypothetical protein
MPAPSVLRRAAAKIRVALRRFFFGGHLENEGKRIPAAQQGFAQLRDDG